MKNNLLIVLCAVFIMVLAGCSGETKAGKKAEDQEPVEEVTNEQTEENHRIVSTTVALTEIMDQLEIDLVAVPTSYKDLPARYAGLPEVGNGMSPDLEVIMSLQPTEVMSVSTLKADLEDGFSGLDFETNYYNFESLDSMLADIIAIGDKYNRVEQAQELVQGFHDKVATIEAEVKDVEGPTVLILLGVPGSYLIATDKSYIGDLVSKAGGVNVFPDEEVDFIAVNTEYLQQSNPDIILRAAHGLPDQVVEMFDEEFKTNDIWKHFDAIKNNKVYDLEETLFGTTGNLAASEALDVLMDILYR